MKDRQPTKVLSNGAIRYGIYNSDGTLNHYEYMKREDAPTVEGTPLNKANLLSDATAQKIWSDVETRPADPTISQALVELRKGKTKIGDILMTARAKPSDAWLLCNGQSIERSNYPQLFELLRSAASPAAWINKTVTGVDRNTDAVCYVNSKWFAFGRTYESPYPMQMYVSEDGITWEHHSYTTNSGFVAGKSVMYYDAEEDVYYIACVRSDYNHKSYILSSDFSTVTELKEFSSTPTQEVYDSRLYKTTDGQLCWAMRRKPASNTGFDVEVLLYTLNKSTKTWSSITIDTNIGAIDYESTTNRFYYVKIAYPTIRVYSIAGLSGDKTQVGSFSAETMSDIVPYIDLSSSTVICIFSNTTSGAGGWKLRYKYSTDRGETWSEGSEPIAGQGGTSTVPSVVESYGYQYVNGLLICTISEAGYSYICSISDPADKAYKTRGTFNGALSPDGLAIMPPTTESVAMCNYADAARPVPTIIPDSRSHAYIKALEE